MWKLTLVGRRSHKQRIESIPAGKRNYTLKFLNCPPIQEDLD